MKEVAPTKAENKHLNNLDSKLISLSEMTQSEREFLNALILRRKPKIVVELGVAAGASSVVILNAIKGFRSRLFSIDKYKNYYRDPSKKTGFIVAAYPELKNNWQLFTGGLASKFLDKIPGKIDLCFIDTVHSNPGEILDTLMILPFMKNGGMIVYHDTSLHTWLLANKQKKGRIFPFSYTNNLLMSVLSGEKLIPKITEQKIFHPQMNKEIITTFPNIGAVVLEPKIYPNKVWEIFNLLTLPWSYNLDPRDQQQIARFFSKYYPAHLVDLFNRAANHNRQYLCQPPCHDESPTEIKLKALVHRLCATKRKLFPQD
jgi:predicted O-methyltransferase YrrM